MTLELDRPHTDQEIRLMTLKHAVILCAFCFSGWLGTAQAGEEVFNHSCEWTETGKGVVGSQPPGCYPLGAPKAVLTKEQRIETASPLGCSESQTDGGKLLTDYREFLNRKIYTVTRYCRHRISESGGIPGQ
jgi:hypothetical protein